MKLSALLLLLILIPVVINAQFPGSTMSGTSADQIIDAKSMALGESSVANPVSPYSFIYNPANLSGLKETSIFFSRRSNNIIDNDNLDYYYYSAGLAAPTSIGNFAFAYSRYNINVPGPINAYYYNYTISAGYSREVLNNLFVGATIKAFKIMNESSGKDYAYLQKTVHNINLLVDLGLLYKFDKPFFTSDNVIEDRLYLGVSVQNLGSNIDVFTETRIDYTSSETKGYPMANYLRAGFSYGLIIPTRLNENTFEFVLSGEYKNLLNPGQYEKDIVDNFGVGFETKFFDLASFNLGGVIKNGDSPQYKKGDLNIYYGFSLNLPLKYLKIGLPFKLGFDYGVITVKDSQPFGGHSMPSYNLTLSYGGKLF